MLQSHLFEMPTSHIPQARLPIGATAVSVPPYHQAAYRSKRESGGQPLSTSMWWKLRKRSATEGAGLCIQTPACSRKPGFCVASRARSARGKTNFKLVFSLFNLSSVFRQWSGDTLRVDFPPLSQSGQLYEKVEALSPAHCDLANPRTVCRCAGPARTTKDGSDGTDACGALFPPRGDWRRTSLAGVHCWIVDSMRRVAIRKLIANGLMEQFYPRK